MMALKMQSSSERVEEYLNSYMMMQIVKQQKRESWTLTCLRKYYFHCYNKYLKLTLGEECRVPNLKSIEDVNEAIMEHGLFFDFDKAFTKRRKGQEDSEIESINKKF